MVGIENYTFMERGKPWAILVEPSGCNQDPIFSQNDPLPKYGITLLYTFVLISDNLTLSAACSHANKLSLLT